MGTRRAVFAMRWLGLLVLPAMAFDGATIASARDARGISASSTANSRTPSPQLTQYDRNALDLARGACANRDFQGLFSAMASSKAVRRLYTASSIQVSVLDANGEAISSRQVAGDEYSEFPVKMMDYYYRPARPAVDGDAHEYLDLEFNQSQHDDYSVEWARVHFDGQSEGGDDLGNMIGANGQRLAPGTHPIADGQLLFRPTKDCWQLIEDTRWLR